MPISPIKNFLCVLVLLAAMALGVAMTTRQVKTTDSSSIEKIDPSTDMVNVEVRILFSHPPESIEIANFGISQKSPSNEFEFTLSLPKEKVTELPLDIKWTEKADATFFSQITIRQDGKEDDVIVLSDLYSEYSDIFTIDTRTK